MFSYYNRYNLLLSYVSIFIVNGAKVFRASIYNQDLL